MHLSQEAVEHMLAARRPKTIVALAVGAGVLVGLIARAANGAAVIVALLVMSSALVAIAQQTLP